MTARPDSGAVIDIPKGPFKLSGSVHDIDRVMQACKIRLMFLENQTVFDFENDYVVYVGPGEAE